jgi:hypothetical protein
MLYSSNIVFTRDSLFKKIFKKKEKKKEAKKKRNKNILLLIKLKKINNINY